MGCDIHVFAEIQINGKWILYSQPRIRRWYELFGKMAGVRDDSQEPISTPKGLPKDISAGTALEVKWWDSDAHTFSWFDDKEISDLYSWVNKELRAEAWKWDHEQIGYLHGNSWGDFYGEIFYDFDGDYPQDVGGIRWVFWFDN